MSNEKHVALAPWSALLTKPGMARILDAEGHIDLTLEKLGEISEWLAAAWENVAGEEYKPVVISEGGYVTDRGVEVVAVVRPGEHVIPKAYLSMPGLDSLEKLERDCE